MTVLTPIRLKAAAVLAGFSLLLSGCLIAPGKFTSQLQLRGDDSFTFTYEGEIFFLGLSGLAEMGAATEEFTANCYNEETYEDRECTEAEIAEQKGEWEAGAEQRAAEAKEQAKEMSAMLGGVDPTDPEAAEELRQLLLRHKGWNRVEDKGDGVFDVSYSVSGTLSHDFIFPIIEGIPLTNPFVEMVLRDGNVVRVNAPGFAAQNENNPMAGMLGGTAAMAGLASIGSSGSDNPMKGMPDVPVIEGTFSIVTDGTILANNTDEGPTETTDYQALTWEISPRTKDAPTALVDMSR